MVDWVVKDISLPGMCSVKTVLLFENVMISEGKSGAKRTRCQDKKTTDA